MEILGAVVPPGLDEAKIIAVRHENVMATSFHPEVTDDLRIHRYFVDLVRAARQKPWEPAGELRLRL